jgi:hypothetical protein
MMLGESSSPTYHNFLDELLGIEGSSLDIQGFDVRGDQLYVRAYGKEAPIQLMGARLASAAMRDDWTDDLVAWLPEYKRHGMNAAVVFWQGSSAGWTNPTRELRTDRLENWEGNAASFCARGGQYVFERDPARRCHQAAFHIEADYAVDSEIGGRMRRIIKAMDALDMVVVVGIFYFRVFQQMAPENKASYDFRRAARRAAEYLDDCRNIMWYPYNEYHWHSADDYGPAMTSERQVVQELKAVNPEWVCGGEAPGLDVQMIDSETYLFNVPSERPLLNVETFALGAGGNDRFSGLCHRCGVWDEDGYTVKTDRHNPATKNDFFREVDGALARPSYHLFAHLQGWYQGAHPLNRSRNFMGMSPGRPGGPELKDVNFYNPASPHYANPVLVADDNQGQGRPGSRGVRWYYEYLRDRYSKVKHPYFENGEWSLRRLIEAIGT